MREASNALPVGGKLPEASRLLLGLFLRKHRYSGTLLSGNGFDFDHAKSDSEAVLL